jgi:hypothetical protein
MHLKNQLKRIKKPRGWENIPQLKIDPACC